MRQEREQRPGPRAARDGEIVYGVDLLRFASALLVMLFHLGFWIAWPGTTPHLVSGGGFAFPLLARFVSVGRMGVEIFFVISGFVIAYSAHSASAGAFLRGRVLRLLPGAWLCATLTLAVVCLARSAEPLEAVAAWVRTVTFSPYGGYIDGVYWTLGVEVAFYLLMLALLHGGWMDHVDAVFATLAALSAAFCVGVFIVDPALAPLARDRTVQLALLVNGGEFAVGVFIWRLLYLGVTPLRLTGLAVGLVGGGLETAKFVTQAHDRVPALALWLAAVALIAASARWNRPIAARLAGRARGWVRAAGIATYPLYMLHQTIGAALMRVLARAGLPPAACLIVTLAAMLGAALLLATRFEPPLRAWLRRLLTPGAPVRWSVEPAIAATRAPRPGHAPPARAA